MGFTLDDAFPSDFLKADDFPKPQTLTIAEVIKTDMLDDKGRNRFKLSFVELPKKYLGMNVINWKTIAGMYGEDTDGWTGNAIKLYKTKTNTPDGIKDCVRIMPVDDAQVTTSAKPAPDNSVLHFVEAAKALFLGEEEKVVAAKISAAALACGFKGQWNKLPADKLDLVLAKLGEMPLDNPGDSLPE